jgi:hypothetical protein
MLGELILMLGTHPNFSDIVRDSIAPTFWRNKKDVNILSTPHKMTA